jgi:site-specific DNA-adenine methylase
MIESIPYSVELYKEAAEIRKQTRLLELSKKELILIATCSYFNILTTFGNINRASAINIDRNGRNHNAKQWQNKKKILKQIINRFENVHIENNDLIAVIKRWDSPKTLFYIDPPYVGSDNDGYKHSEYYDNDFSNLVDTLNKLKGNYILSTSKQKTEPSNVLTMSKIIQNGINGSDTREEILYIKSPVSISVPESFIVSSNDS